MVRPDGKPKQMRLEVKKRIFQDSWICQDEDVFSGYLLQNTPHTWQPWGTLKDQAIYG
jgi:hypothetical protein